MESKKTCEKCGQELKLVRRPKTSISINTMVKGEKDPREFGAKDGVGVWECPNCDKKKK